jgi:hypothetical protein
VLLEEFLSLPLKRSRLFLWHGPSQVEEHLREDLLLGVVLDERSGVTLLYDLQSFLGALFEMRFAIFSLNLLVGVEGLLQDILDLLGVHMFGGNLSFFGGEQVAYFMKEFFRRAWLCLYVVFLPAVVLHRCRRSILIAINTIGSYKHNL